MATKPVISIRPFGPQALLLDCQTLQAALAVHAQLAARPHPGVVELVPAAQTVLVRCATEAYAHRFAREFTGENWCEAASTQASERTIDVVYEGEDLAEVAELTGLSIQGVIAAHTGQRWQVAFTGFAPGFFYLHATENRLQVPRHPSPRTAVPPGAVGLAGNFSGIYPRSSPGGWQLIGSTTAPLWDLAQNPPALLEPGQTVRFQAVREHIKINQKQTKNEPVWGRAIATVLSPGAQLLYQDTGRRGLTHWGVSPSGFADPPAAHAANRLVGNEAGATVLESLMGNFSLHAQHDSVLAITGARADMKISERGQEDRQVPADTAFALLAGQKLSVGLAQVGLRIYLAARGGFTAETQAQSSSTDTLAGIGPAPIQAKSVLAVGSTVRGVVQPPAPPLALPNPRKLNRIRIIPGPRDNWFSLKTLTRFTSTSWRVTEHSNRIGVRLEQVDSQRTTEIFERIIPGELPSEGMIAGAIQIPPGGHPVVFLADHPVTGGYPVLATVDSQDLRLLAQAQPGVTLQFIIQPKEAQGENCA